MNTHVKTYTDRVHLTDRADILDVSRIEPEEQRRMCHNGEAQFRSMYQGDEIVSVLVRIRPEARHS